MQKYLYLTQLSWTTAWLHGGRVPLKLASAYRRIERAGIYTPDENLIYDSTHDLDSLWPAVSVHGNVKNLSIKSVTVNGHLIAKNVRSSRYEQDGVILSFCNRKSSRIARRLEKLACVKILDVDLLKAIIDQQLGAAGISGPCEYIDTFTRNHFLKSREDEWQDEFRIFWSHPENVEINLPAGIAKKIKL